MIELIQNGGSGESPLTAARIREIVASGVDVNAAVEMGPDKFPFTALLGCCDLPKDKAAECGKALLKCGANPRFQGPFGFTALLQCAQAGLVEFARALVEADPSLLRDYSGAFALQE